MRASTYLSVAFSLIAAACGDTQSTDDDHLAAQGQVVTRQQVVEAYAQLVYLSYADSLRTAKALQGAIDNFLDAPTAAKYEYAKRAWLDARVPYGQTEAYRFYNGPIDNEDEGGPEGQLNAWPLDESFIDYTATDASKGIINDGSITAEAITKAYLANLNGHNGTEENVATGYHAIEFLLWGQDREAFGPGDRPFTDYTDAPNADKRAKYLREATSLLIDDLEMLVDAWAPDRSDNYRTAFVSGDTNTALRNILIGIGTLSTGELSGERMDVALSSGAQEDEHSCFSDNTHVDILMNHTGIKNVYLGRYGDFDGPGINDLVRLVDPELDDAMQALLDTSSAKIQAIPIPFDQAIIPSNTEGQGAVDAAVQALSAQGNEVVKVAEALGLGNISVDI